MSNIQKSVLFAILLPICGSLVPTASAQSQRAYWSSELSGRGVDNYVFSLEVFDDGSGPAVFAGGQFARTSAGAVVNRVAKWSRGQWSDLDGGVHLNNGANGSTDMSVQALLSAFDGVSPVLYVAGWYGIAGSTQKGLSIARWTGAEWLNVGWGVLGSNSCIDCPAGVFALASVPSSNNIIIAGTFGFTGPQHNPEPHENIAEWDGENWHALGIGLFSDPLIPIGNALAYYDDGSGPVLYVGGGFLRAGGVRSQGIARWNGSAWSDVGSGVVPGPNNWPFHLLITEFAVFNDGTGPALYAAGNFIEIDGVKAGNIARWDGQNWTNLKGGTDGPVGALAVFDDGTGPALYVGGSFTSAGGVAVNNIARWDGTTWSNVGTGVVGDIHSMTTLDEGDCRKLYVGGLFTNAGGVASENIAVWQSCSCYADCDQSTGVGVLDILDFLCFQDSFVSSEPYACDCDITTGQGVCDIFDFLCFQNGFVAGCK